jgi:DNA-binding NarL/FixJ family response regulator
MPSTHVGTRSAVAERPGHEERPPLRLVVADDDKFFTDLLRLLLENLGHEVVGTARDGHEALALTSATNPDVLLLDIAMPGMDGLEACRRIMEERPLPIVMLTGHDDQRLVAEADQCGASGFLVKPVESRQLAATVALARLRFLDRPAPRPTMQAAPEQSASDPDDAGQRARLAPERIRVMLADRNQMLAQSLSVILGADAEIELVGIQKDPDLIVPQIQRMRPDVLLVSHPILQESGGRLAAALPEALNGARLIVLTARRDKETVADCLRVGAVGFVPMEQEPDDLIQAIKRAHAGEVLFPPELLMGLVTWPIQRPVPTPQGASAQLAPREIEVLQTLAAGLSTEEAASHLAITIHTVRTHLKNAMVKLEVHSKLEAVMAALRMGLIELPK